LIERREKRFGDGLTTNAFLIGVDPLVLRPRRVQKHGGIVGATRDFPMTRPPREG
jgi:hypothetical protein